jgi:hypothetical protein
LHQHRVETFHSTDQFRKTRHRRNDTSACIANISRKANRRRDQIDETLRHGGKRQCKVRRGTAVDTGLDLSDRDLGEQRDHFENGLLNRIIDRIVRREIGIDVFREREHPRVLA